MKILSLTHSYAGNGAAIMLLAVLKHWAGHLGWQIDALVGRGSEWAVGLEELGIHPINECRNGAYDLVLINTVLDTGYLDQIKGAVPTLLWVHEGAATIAETKWTAAEWQQRLSLASRIIFQTRWQVEEVFKEFLCGVDPSRIAIVPNGLPPIPPGELGSAAKAADKKRIAFVGGLCARKRPQDLARAVRAIGRPDIECVFVGPTHEMATLGERNIALLKSDPTAIRLIGRRSRIEALEYLKSADVYCLPSSDESYCVANLEAGLLGVPCVLSDLPPYRGIWTHEENCLLHKAGDIDGLTRNIARLIDDPRLSQELVANARALAQRHDIGTFLAEFTRHALEARSTSKPSG
jgi:glycosyltransferase involved in cell wall biosynthesis